MIFVGRSFLQQQFAVVVEDENRKRPVKAASVLMGRELVGHADGMILLVYKDDLFHHFSARATFISFAADPSYLSGHITGIKIIDITNHSSTIGRPILTKSAGRYPPGPNTMRCV